MHVDISFASLWDLEGQINDYYYPLSELYRQAWKANWKDSKICDNSYWSKNCMNIWMKDWGFNILETKKEKSVTNWRETTNNTKQSVNSDIEFASSQW